MINKRYLEIESLLFGKVDLNTSDITPIENTTLTELMKQIDEANDSSPSKGHSSIAGSSKAGDVTSSDENSYLGKGNANSAGDILNPQEEVEVSFIANP